MEKGGVRGRRSMRGPYERGFGWGACGGGRIRGPRGVEGHTRKERTMGIMRAIGSVLAALGLPLAACTADQGSVRAGEAASPYVLDFTMERIDGEAQDLAEYEGRVVMMVNVASRCGFTKQYEQLQAMQERYGDEGFVVLGFPANNFMGQEPGTNEEIAAFCETEFGVTFPMFAKISVKGGDCHPLYERLAGQPEPIGGAPKWNFTKFLVDREGRVVARFGSRTSPDDPKVVEEVERLLAAG